MQLSPHQAPHSQEQSVLASCVLLSVLQPVSPLFHFPSLQTHCRWRVHSWTTPCVVFCGCCYLSISLLHLIPAVTWLSTSFLSPNNNPLQGDTLLHLSVLQLMDVWAVSTFWLIGIMMLWIFMYKLSWDVNFPSGAEGRILVTWKSSGKMEFKDNRALVLSWNQYVLFHSCIFCELWKDPLTCVLDHTVCSTFYGTCQVALHDSWPLLL